MPWKPSVEGEVPTLGWYVLDWITENLAQPALGDYEPFVPYREQEDFILRWYELDPRTGRFKYGRGLLGRPRGWGKSPLLGALCLAEGLADVLFDGWDADGQPIGRPWATIRTPLVHVAAVSEDQTHNTWQPMVEMCAGPVIDNYPGLEPFDTLVNLPRGRIERRTSSGRTVKGAPTTFAVLDQALALDTPLPTPSGWTTMGAVQSGDWLVGADGRPVRVVEAKPVSMEHDCYRVTFSDGTSMVASEGHLWQTKVRSSAARPRVRTTGEMARDGRAFRVPVAPPIERPDADLPVPPYLLGLWLGDGTRGKCELSVHGDDLAATQAALLADGVVTYPRRYKASPGGYSNAGDQVNLSFTKAVGFGMTGRPEVAKRLQEMPCYRDKHVPKYYLLGSIKQRSDLLAGLMDSDGCCTATGTCTFVNTSRALADAVVALLRSLGQVTSGAKWVADDRYTGGGKYRVDFTPRAGLIPFRLPRKASRVRQHRRSPDWITVESIEPVPRVPVRCVAVESEDHLFAAGEGCHLTHNTEEWVPSNGGPSLAQKIRTNTAKNGGRTIESPNAYTPGEGSVAEASAKTAEAAAEGRTKLEHPILWDHREAPADTDMSDRESLVLGLRTSYGDSSGHPDGCVLHTPPCAPGHVDLEAQIALIWDPATDPQTARSDYLNQITHASDSWLSQPEWLACFDGGKVVGAKEPVVLGFDGSKGRTRGRADATALVGCRVSDGHMFLRPGWVWEQPSGPAGRDWTPPAAEVDAAVRDAFARYNVVGFYADPTGWTSYVAEWEAKYGKRLRVKASVKAPITAWPRGKKTDAAGAVAAMHAAVLAGELSHDGSSELTRHVLNARRRAARTGYLLYKDFPESPNKIDAAYAAVMAWKARLDAVTAGIGKPRREAAPEKQRVVVMR